MDDEEQGMRQAFIHHLVANIQCANCGERYARNDIYVLGHHEDVWVSAVVCSRCGTQGLVFATLRSGSQFELQSKPETEEAGGSGVPPALSVDDVLDVHAYLRDFHGDVYALLREWSRQKR